MSLLGLDSRSCAEFFELNTVALTFECVLIAFSQA